MVKNNIVFLALRASAEGFNANAVKVELKKLETKLREEAVAAARRGWSGFQGVANEHMVGVLTSTHYKGGYMYPGSTVSPNNFQAVDRSRPEDCQDSNPEGAREWLDAAEIGTVVEELYVVGNGASREIYQKTQQGWGYIKTNYESEERDAERRRYLYGNEAAVAATLGVAVSPTFRAIYQEMADQLYYGL